MEKKQLNGIKAFRFRRFTNKAYGAFNSMHKVVNIGVLAGCVLTFAHVTETSAQSAISKMPNSEKISEQELEEVLVTASRVELPLSTAAKLVTVISKDEIRQSPIQSIQDLLIYASGIDVQQRGGHGVSCRHIGPRRIVRPNSNFAEWCKSFQSTNGTL